MTYTFWGNMNIECCVRLLVACLCGSIIGIERTKRSKGAGIRTHMIVCIGAALFVIVSKYGFLDIVYLEGAQVDVSRIASNIVTGISFLGAGIIFMRGDSIQGLTTAAGIWVTAAIGLASGSGMYTVSIMGTILILVVQVLMHRGPIKGMENLISSNIVVAMDDDPKAFEEFCELIKSKNIKIQGNHIKRHKDNTLTYTLDVKMPKDLPTSELLAILKESANVKSIGL